MKKLYSPENDAELAIIKSVFESEGINYFVHNDHFGTLQIGPKIDLFNAKTIMVQENQFEIAKELICEFLENIKDSETPNKLQYSWADKLRMVIETVLFTWFIPGKRHRRR